ncbi:MAG: ABC transporter permease [Wenzhouxiangellaceae bacterium]
MKKNLWELVWFRAYADLKSEASRTYIGILWWILDPLMQMGIFYLVFGVGLRGTGRTENFVQFLLIGIIIWRWFATSVNFSSGAIMQNRNLVLRLDIDKWVFPATLIAGNAFKFLIAFTVLIIFLKFSGMPLTWHYLQIPVVLGVQLVLICGVAFTLAALVPLLPDLRNVISHMLMLMFFLSGIFYDPAQMPEKFQWIFDLNPMVHVINANRAIMLHGEMPAWPPLLVVLVLGLVLMWIGIRLMRSLNVVYAKALQAA